MMPSLTFSVSLQAPAEVRTNHTVRKTGDVGNLLSLDHLPPRGWVRGRGMHLGNGAHVLHFL